MGFLSESLLLEVGTLLTCTLAVIYIYFKWSFTYWKKRNVPYIEPIFPFGNFTDMALKRKSLVDVCSDIYNRLEGHKYGGTYIFTIPQFLVRDPDFIKDVLVKDFSSFHDHGVFMNEEIEPLSGSLFNLAGEKWRKLRFKLTPTFTSGKMKMMFQRFLECGQVLQNCLEYVGETGDEIEMKDILARFSTDIISSCAFGIECNCLKNEDAEFRKWGRKIFEPSLKRLVIGLLSGIAPVVLETLKLSSMDSDVSKYFRNLVQETVEYRDKNNVKRNDFLQLLIQLKNKGSLDDEQKTENQNNETIKNTETTEGTYTPN
jgi:cytochrome P450 family 6